MTEKSFHTDNPVIIVVTIAVISKGRHLLLLRRGRLMAAVRVQIAVSLLVFQTNSIPEGHILADGLLRTMCSFHHEHIVLIVARIAGDLLLARAMLIAQIVRMEGESRGHVLQLDVLTIADHSHRAAVGRVMVLVVLHVVECLAVWGVLLRGMRRETGFLFLWGSLFISGFTYPRWPIPIGPNSHPQTCMQQAWRFAVSPNPKLSGLLLKLSSRNGKKRRETPPNSVKGLTPQNPKLSRASPATFFASK